MMRLDLITSPQSYALLIFGIAIYAYRRWHQRNKVKSSPQPLTSSSKGQTTFSEDAYNQVTPLLDLDVASEEPIKIRPFKPKYHLTMAIENITIDDLFAMDKTYTERVTLRRSLYEEQGKDVLAVNQDAIPAIMELYDYLITMYLPTRFPTVFATTPSGLYNKITRETLPTQPESAHTALHLLGTNIDTDLLLLLPIRDPGADVGKYRLEAFNTCFPSGFNTHSKLGLKLADIHGPVPSYATKLERSMDRFFASLPVGKLVKRHNWSITTNNVLFNLSGNHITEEQGDDVAVTEGWDDIDLKQTVLRCERQTLHRLPWTGAILFAFKTYTYGLQELKEEGCGEELASAIEGLGEGNAPGMVVYKRQIVWGEKVKAFLTGQVDLQGNALMR